VTALDGVRVVELGDAQAEWLGKLLADMGADVIKVEPPRGGSSRSVGPFLEDAPHPDRSLFFWHYNTSKRGVTLDIENDEGRRLLIDLLRTADVFIETLPPGEAARLGLSYQTLESLNPRLIHVAVTPFGQDGPYVDAGYKTTDLVTMALGGPMHTCGYDPEAEDTPPVRPGHYHSYHTASHYACFTTLVALWEREASGGGQFIDVSAQATLAVTVEFANLNWEYERATVRRQTGRHSGVRPTARTQYMCADGRAIDFGLPRDEATWQRLLEYLKGQGLAEGLDEELFRDPARRFERGGAVMNMLEVLTALHTAEELFHIGQSLGVTWGAVRAPEEWLEDPHAQARGTFAEVEHPELGRSVTYPGAPYHFMATPWRIRRRAPLLGEDNLEVFGELGLSAADVTAYVEAGIM
jgi:crotonobetainyl-CoA:carnitine CoA-transferase CaiB-like acyl-CoA transferase